MRATTMPAIKAHQNFRWVVDVDIVNFRCFVVVFIVFVAVVIFVVDCCCGRCCSCFRCLLLSISHKLLARIELLLLLMSISRWFVAMFYPVVRMSAHA